ncbi:MAG: hypothetical protein H0S84_10255 [Bacteroidales bacterium]|jgi:uncharacterized protein involved in exopolysaccharide biosynthesis|nr:hypothetical protein [Bacteroidales bacterium]MDN5350530.1 hypothetical protein [Bacteroidales bacterium]
MDNYFNNTSLVRLLLKWKYHLAVIFVVAVILGAIFSGPAFITPLYKSEAIAYPANINAYSDESETEQMLQIIQSQDIVDSVTKRFNLMEHYKIDPEYPYWRSVLLEEYHDRVKISKTMYEAISITVMDKDPQIAADMADAILYFYNVKIADLHKSKRREVIDMYDKQLRAKRALIDSLKNQLEVLGTTYGLIDYSVQSQEIMRGYLKTFDGSDARAVNNTAVKELKENIQKLGGELLTTVEMLQHESRTYVDIKVEYEQELRFYNSNLTYSNVISKPYPSDKKAYPVRWIIVTLAAVGGLLIAILVIFALENKKKLTDYSSAA